jgi:Tfp pilus assembly protein PilF
VLENEIAMARLCERRGENDEAERMYRVLLKRAPQDPRPHHRLGVLAVQKGRYAEAEEEFCTAKCCAPASAELLSDMGYCCYLQARFKPAEDLFRQALQAQPSDSATISRATNNLALVVGVQGRLDEALNLFKRVNNEAEAFANLAYVLAQSGQGARAEQMYLHALSLDNTMRAAAQAMLQVAERGQAWAQTVAANGQPPVDTPPASALPAAAATPRAAEGPVRGTAAPAGNAAGQPETAPGVPPAPVGSTDASNPQPTADQQSHTTIPAMVTAVLDALAPARHAEPVAGAPTNPLEARIQQPAADEPPPPPVPPADPVPLAASAPSGQPGSLAASPGAPTNPLEARVQQPAADEPPPPPVPPVVPAGFDVPLPSGQRGPDPPPYSAKTPREPAGVAFATDTDNTPTAQPEVQHPAAERPVGDTSPAPATPLRPCDQTVEPLKPAADDPPPTEKMGVPGKTASPRGEEAAAATADPRTEPAAAPAGAGAEVSRTMQVEVVTAEEKSSQ